MLRLEQNWAAILLEKTYQQQTKINIVSFYTDRTQGWFVLCCTGCCIYKEKFFLTILNSGACQIPGFVSCCFFYCMIPWCNFFLVPSVSKTFGNYGFITVQSLNRSISDNEILFLTVRLALPYLPEWKTQMVIRFFSEQLKWCSIF